MNLIRPIFFLLFFYYLFFYPSFGALLKAEEIIKQPESQNLSSNPTQENDLIIQKQLNIGKQVLYLLPEIALTTQIIIRLKNIFGNRIGVYHSKFSDSERVEIWNNVRSNKNDSYQIILGVRSSIFLPFKNLGLIIIDEEHENTYKQYDPSPRYNARDAAIVLAK